MPMTSAASEWKKANAKLATARVHLYYQGSAAANVANDLSSKIQKLRTESPPDEPFGKPDFSTCLRPLRILADMLGFPGDGEMVGHVNSEDAKKLFDKMALRIKSCGHLSIDVSTKPKQAIFGLVCGRQLRQYNDAMADVAIAKQLLESVLSELPAQPPQTVEAVETVEAEPMETEQPEQRFTGRLDNTGGKQIGHRRTSAHQGGSAQRRPGGCRDQSHARAAADILADGLGSAEIVGQRDSGGHGDDARPTGASA
jgi:hypothetical protein